MMGTQILYEPSKRLDIKAQAEWDNAEDTVAFADLSAFYKLTDRFRFGGGYLARDHKIYDYALSPVDEWNHMQDSLVYFGFTHDINDTWSWSTYVRYDVRKAGLEEVGGYIQYSLDCLVFQVRTAYEGSYERIDGTERENDFRIAFMMWLKVENKKPADEWLTW